VHWLPTFSVSTGAWRGRPEGATGHGVSLKAKSVVLFCSCGTTAMIFRNANKRDRQKMEKEERMKPLNQPRLVPSLLQRVVHIVINSLASRRRVVSFNSSNSLVEKR
jgi:hypothetical protein